MTTKAKVKRQTRGWFPKEPTVGIIKSTRAVGKTGWRYAIPSWTPGLMIVTSLISALFGAILVSAYIVIPAQAITTSASGGGISDGHFLYAGLYMGILSVIAFVLGLSSGFLLLARKCTLVALTSIIIVFSFGLATLWLPAIDGEPWYSGFLVAAPMIASVFGLIKLGINYRRLVVKNGNEPPNILGRLLGGLGIAGGALSAMGIVSYFVPFEFLIGQLNVLLLILGIPLLIGALLSRRILKKR